MTGNKISVIIPCYNVEKFIDQAVQSALAQTYTNVEIILVDDGSTDGTASICDYYAEKYANVKVIHQKNSGQAYARNIGLEQATGEYIYFLDSDDWIEQETFTSIMKKVVVNNVDVIFFDAYVVDEDAKKLEDDRRYVKADLKEIVLSGKEWYQLMIERGIFSACVPYHLFKRTFLQDNQLKFVPGIIREDEFFLFLVYLKAKRVLRDCGVYYYRRLRMGSTMMSPDYVYMFDSMQAILSIVLDQYENKEFIENEIEALMVFMNRIEREMFVLYSKMELPERKDRVKSMRRTLIEYGKVMLLRGRIESFSVVPKQFYYIFKINQSH